MLTPAMSILQTECFGPVASVIKAADYEAAGNHNDSDYGLRSVVIIMIYKSIALAWD